MAAILKVGNFIELPIRLEINDAGKPAVFNFKLTAKRLNVPEWQAHFGEDGEHKHQLVRDFLLDHITAWQGQTLVIDADTNQPAAFSRDHLDLMLSLLGVQGVIFAAYLKEVLKAAAPEGRAKN